VTFTVDTHHHMLPDFFWQATEGDLRCRKDIETSPELTESERTAVLGATAMTLIPRLASLRSRSQTHAS
jgi:hypothetical protein